MIRVRHKPDRTGAAAMELAILLPFVCFMFAVAVDFCRVFYCTQTLEQCAQSAAYYATGYAWGATDSASVGTTSASGSARDYDELAKKAGCADGVTLSPPLKEDQISVIRSGSQVTVTVDYSFQMLTPLMGDVGLVHLQRKVVMKSAPRPGD